MHSSARISLAVIAFVCAVMSASSSAADAAADEKAFRALYKELVEIDTTRSKGDCTRAAEATRAHVGRRHPGR